MSAAAVPVGDAERGRTEAHDLFVDVHGTRIHYVRAGAGRPLVMIHGLTGSTMNWDRNIPAVAERAEVYAVDLVNMGQSDRRRGIDTGLAATADRVAAWMDAVGLAEADIAGHSHGGAVAIMLAARHPARVRSLMLFAPANPYCSRGRRLIGLYSSAPGGTLARLVPFLPRPIHMLALGRMYGDRARIGPGCIEGYVRGLKVPGTMEHVLGIVCNWHREMKELERALPQVKHVRAMLVWGDRDRAVGLASGERLRREFLQSEWVVVPGAGHVPFEEMPETCNRAMLRWLDGLESRKIRAQSVNGLRQARSHEVTARAAGRVAASGLRQVSG